MRMQLVTVLAVGLAGCSSIDKNIAFAPGNPQAFVLVAGDGMTIDGSNSYVFTFQRFDAANGSFAKDIKTVKFSGLGAAVEGNEFSRPANHGMTMRFGGGPLPAGDWALISRSDYRSAGTFNSIFVNCYAQGARVFRMAPGAVNLVSVGAVGGGRAVGGDDMAAQQAREVLAGYPGIAAPIVPAKLIGQTSFDTGKGLLGGDNCTIKQSTGFVPAP